MVRKKSKPYRDGSKEYIEREEKNRKTIYKNNAGCSANNYRPDCPSPYAEDPIYLDCVKKPVRGAGKYCFSEKSIKKLNSLQDPTNRQLLPRQAIKLQMGKDMDILAWYYHDSKKKEKIIDLAAAKPTCEATRRVFNAMNNKPAWQIKIVEKKPQCFGFRGDHRPTAREVRAYLANIYRDSAGGLDTVLGNSQIHSNRMANKITKTFIS